jgi:AcrR family transcriptional regulator
VSTSSSPTAPGRRELTKQANRSAILDAALGVFVEIGYGAATVRDIIRRTGLAAGTFYNYFPDKETVFRALLDDAAERARVQVRAGRQAGTTLRAFIHGGYLAYFRFMAEDPAIFNLVRRNAGTVRELLGEPQLGAGTEELRTDLDDAIRRGLLPSMDTEYVASAMVGVGMEVAMRMLERDPVDPAGAAEFATDLFLRGLPQ